jgi:amino acid transporter
MSSPSRAEVDHSIPDPKWDRDGQDVRRGGDGLLGGTPGDDAEPLLRDAVDGTADSEYQSPPSPGRSLTLLNTVALCVSLQIGAGLFAAPSQVSQFVPSPGAGVLEWAVGGLFVWTGAATFIELGVAIPENGGPQEYLRRGLGEWMGFIFATTWVALTKPASMAIVAVVFAEYLLDAIYPFLGAAADGPPLWMIKAVGVAGLTLLTVINCAGATAGATVANGFFAVKMAALASVIGLGFSSAPAGLARGVPASLRGWFGADPAFDGLPTWERLGRLVTALFGVLYVYGGWESIGFSLGDVRDPVRTLPRAMALSMGICIAGFTLMSAALYVALPMDVIRENNAVAVVSPVPKSPFSLPPCLFHPSRSLKAISLTEHWGPRNSGGWCLGPSAFLPTP